LAIGFEKKLVSSSWDVPLIRSDTATTGFSGTNDSQAVFPMSIEQRDLPHLSHTNAEVLSYLLETRNSDVLLAASPNGRPLTVLEVLQLIKDQDPPVKILIDAGAIVLEMDNEEVAKTWLHLELSAPAAIYFSRNDEVLIMTRDGRIDLLSSSPYSGQIGNCLVFLDEFHTRGELLLVCFLQHDGD
jgi:hypothetical protein